MNELNYDIVVVGASLGGAAAAIRAGAMSASVVVLEASTWVGGQFTGQGVNKPDENRFIESYGSTAAYRGFRHDVRLFYRQNHHLSPSGSAMPLFNPGGSTPGFATEPLVGHQILKQKLESSGNIHLRLQTAVTTVELDGDAVHAVIATGPDGVPTRYLASMFLDATDLGDLLPAASVEFRLGAEGKDETGEAAAPAHANGAWIQPITVPIALERRPAGEDYTIARPGNYDALKASQNYTIVDGYIDSMFDAGRDMWSYRRFIAASNFNDPAFAHDLSMINTGSNDYQGGTLPTGNAATDAAIVEGARQATLGYLYWLQTECPRSDGVRARGFPELRPRPDVFGTADGTAALPYIREGRRIQALTTILQADLDADGIDGPRGKLYPDSCGIGLYGGLDIHSNDNAGMPQTWINIKPFQIPLGALIPKRVTNLLAACKNIGTTHITNGAYRLHPIEWNVGEAAGALAAFAISRHVSPASVRSDAHLLEAFQHELLAAGVPLFWWTDVAFGDPLFQAVQLLGVRGIASGYDDMRFGVHDQLSDGDRDAIDSKVTADINWPSNPISRGDAALVVAAALA